MMKRNPDNEIDVEINIDWTLAPDWARHHAIDVCGAGFWYENRPHAGQAGQWIHDLNNEGRIMGSGYFRQIDDSIIGDREAWRSTRISMVEDLSAVANDEVAE